MIIGVLNALRIMAAIALVIFGINRLVQGQWSYGAIDFTIAIFFIATIQSQRNAR